MAQKQIKALPKKLLNYAIKKGKDPKTQQTIQRAITKGAREAVKLLSSNNKDSTEVTSSPSALQSNNTATDFLKETAAETIKAFLPEENEQLSQHHNLKSFSSSIGNKRKKAYNRINSYYTHPKKSKTLKRKKYTNINSLIARS